MTITQDERGMRFVAEILDDERRFLRAGFLNPPECNNAGYRASLRGRHFLDPAHSFLYCYICRCAERAKVASPTMAAKLAAHLKLCLSLEDIWFILDPIFSEEQESIALDDLARQVTKDSAKVDQWYELERKQEAILDRDPRELIPRREPYRPKARGNVPTIRRPVYV